MNGIASAAAQSVLRRCRWGRRGSGVAAAADEAATRTTHPVAPTAETLVRLYGEAVFAYAARRLEGRADAEDVTAETFAAAFASLNRCPLPPDRTASNGDESGAPDWVRAWLLGIARRKVADACRKRARRRETSLEDLAADAPATLSDRVERRPEPLLLRGEASEALRAAVDGLKPDQREALLLKYVEELSLAEIARIMDRSPQAVSSLLQRARATAFARGRAYFAPQTAEERTQTP